jgi:hypothetical protein
MEIWATIEEAPNYEISTQGRVRNKKTGRVLKPHHNRLTDTFQVTLMTDRERITRQIKKLKREAFGE